MSRDATSEQPSYSPPQHPYYKVAIDVYKAASGRWVWQVRWRARQGLTPDREATYYGTGTDGVAETEPAAWMAAANAVDRLPEAIERAAGKPGSPTHGRPSGESLASPSVSLDDLPGTWRVDVERCWRGLSMEPTFGAKLLVRDDRTRRWSRRGLVVYNDDGPIQAISDLLSALDVGLLR